MRRRLACVTWLMLPLSGCGLVLDLDPRADASIAVMDAGDRADAGGMDASTLDAGVSDAGAVDAGGIDAATPLDASDPDAGPPALVTCTEDTTWREERFVVGGSVDVAARASEAAVVYHQAADRVVVQLLDGSLTPTTQHPWDGVVDPVRLAAGSVGFRMVYGYGSVVSLVTPPGGSTGMTTGTLRAVGLARVDGPLEPAAAILFGPTFGSPLLIELTEATSSFGVRSVVALGDGTRATDARLAHDLASHAYAVAWTDAAGAHVAGFDDATLALLGGRADVPPSPGAALPPQPDLSLAIAPTRVAVAFREALGGATAARVTLIDASGSTRSVDLGPDPGSTVSVASGRGSPLLGVARIVGGELVFEARLWSGLGSAAVTVRAATEGDLLDLEAEPASASFLVARKHREGAGPLTVTRIRCAVAD